MKNMSLEKIAEACKGQLYAGSTDVQTEVISVTLDSRQVTAGSLFIATRGERVDGHDFIEAVYEKGAACVISEKELTEPRGAYILVENSFQALKDIAAYYRSVLQIKVVGITGSVGQTSTKEMIASVLEQKYKVLKTAGNFNNEVGLPLTILNIREEHEIAVVEMGISDFGEMHRLSAIARPDVCVITNIGQCHLENLKSREGILKAKSEIFDFIKEDAAICLNGDDDLLATLQDVKGIKPLFFGKEKTNHIYATDIVSLGLEGTTCKIHRGEEVTEVQIPIPGGHMVLNALAAAAVGTVLGLSSDLIRQGVAATKSLGGRSNLIKTTKGLVIDDCYNANPMSMRAAIDLLSYANTRRVAILGDMFELGANSDRLHYETGEYAAQSEIEVLVLVGENAKHMNDAVDRYLTENPQRNCEKYYFGTREEAMQRLPSILKERDAVLVKASHGMGFQQIVSEITKEP